jgi:hypothetical protein
MRKFLLLFFVLIFSNQVFSQSKLIQYAEFMNFKNKDSIIHPRLVYFSASYTLANNSKTLTISNLPLTFGINVARFFTKKINLMASMDLGIIAMLNFTTLKPNFENDFSNSFNSKLKNNVNGDSIKANLLNSQVGNNNNTLLAYGISFSPYPNKYGGIILECKMGIYSHKIGILRGTIINQKPFDADNLYWGFKYESLGLTCKPILFFKKKKMQHEQNSFLVGIFLNNIHIAKSQIYDLPLSNFMSKSFLDKYQTTFLVGLKIGYGVW